jgi:DNA-binding SARP family transcriptional activator/tetratricopeptide (TPR) repeat protein
VQTGERWFSVLGPVRAWVGSVEVELGPPQQRAVLAVLLLEAGRRVAVHQLVDALWGSAPPASAGPAIRTYVSRLRRILPVPPGASRPVIESSAAGYRLLLVDDQLDLAVFREHLRVAESARSASDLAGAAESLRQGLALWQGEALAGLPGEQLQVHRSALTLLQLDARAALLVIEVELGNVGGAAADLAGLVAEHPLDERFSRLLMLALYRSGRQAAALEVYQNTRQVLGAELGVEPGPELQELHGRILRVDPQLLTPGPGARIARPGSAPAVAADPEAGQRRAGAIPAQLSADLVGFTGRTVELARLDGFLPTGGDPSTMTVIVIHGMPGAGKTTLAVQWAQRIAHRFPDGQLQLNLRGFDADDATMTAAEALRRMFDGLGVAPQQIPMDVEAQTVLLRSVLSGRRVLILLDNARDADQVRPLLPGGNGCLVIVTSRNQLRSLVARDEAQPLALDVMTHSQARDFLVQRIGAQRIRTEQHAGGGPDEVDAIIGLCGGLPLALSIVASRLVMEPESSLVAVVAQLRADVGTLEAFSDVDEAIDLRTIFSWSYQQLDPEAAGVLRALAQHPGPDTALEVAASMAGLPVRRARILAGGLVRAHLVREQSPGRFVLHDLVRAYAVERSLADDAERERRTRLERMLDHYLVWARAAIEILRPPYWHVIEVPAPSTPVVPADLADEAAARDWSITEHHALTSAIELADRAGLDRYVWQLTALVGEPMRRYGYWPAALRIQTLALGAGIRLGDRTVQATAHRALGQVHIRLGSPEQAEVSLGRSLALLDELADDRGRSLVFSVLSFIHLDRGDYPSALLNIRRTLDLARSIGDPIILAYALNDYGWTTALAGDYLDALDYCRQALALSQELNDRYGMAGAWDSLGFIQARLGDQHESALCYEQAVPRFREIGDRQSESAGLVQLGNCYLGLGREVEARAVWQRAHAIYLEFGDAEAERVQQLLDQLPGSDLG